MILSNFIIYYKLLPLQGTCKDECFCTTSFPTLLFPNQPIPKFILLTCRIQFVNFYKIFKFQINYINSISDTCSAPGTNFKIILLNFIPDTCFAPENNPKILQGAIVLPCLHTINSILLIRSSNF